MIRIKDKRNREPAVSSVCLYHSSGLVLDVTWTG